MLTAGMDGLGDLATTVRGAGRTGSSCAHQCMGARSSRPVALQPLTTLRLMLTLGRVAPGV